MQQQDNDFPIDQIQSGTNPPNSGLAGGTTFQPQTGAQPTAVPGVDPAPAPTPPPAPATAPNWQQTASSDTAELYAQPVAPVSSVPNPMPPATPVPDASSVPDLATPSTDVGQTPVAMQQDFAQANQISTPSPAPVPLDMNQPNNPVPPVTPQEPLPAAPEPNMVPAPSMETPAPMPANPLMSAPTPEPAQAPMPGLPGSDQLGQAALGMDQSSAPTGMDPNMAGVDPLAANMEGMGAYGPPPNSKKKLIFIIGGAVLGIVIIGVVIFVITRSSARKPAQNLSPTTQQQTTPTPTPTPSSGPATPPQGYVTIDKQCYTFALFEPNTVPADQACTFKDATFGKLKTSKISVISTTEAYKNLDEFVNAIKPTLTVTSAESIKLDNFDAKQLIYKASDGKTYSRVLALIVGKSYQQDGKPVTGIDITTSYQEDFDKTVTKNVLDTWRWK